MFEILIYNDYFKLRVFNWFFVLNYFCCVMISLLNLCRKLIKELMIMIIDNDNFFKLLDCEGMLIKMNW